MPSQSFRSFALQAFAAIVVLGVIDTLSEARILLVREPRRFAFKIDPTTSQDDLLPVPSKPAPMGLPSLSEDVFAVPELDLGEPVLKSKKEPDFEEAAAHQMAKINVLNRDGPDGFVKALRLHRPDLRGLPFLMGKACQSDVKSAQVFAETVAIVQKQLNVVASRDPEAASVPNAAYTEKLIWGDFPLVLNDKGDKKSQRHLATQSELDRAALAALSQMLPTRPALYQACYAKHLATIPERSATETLARLALFAPDDSVRQAAIAGLKDRPAADYAKTLMLGFRYPLPVISQRAADALIKLKCKDVLTDLVAVLEEPDPRSPRKQQVDDQETSVVREVVRVNHHRNCLLCHPPANTPDVPKNVLTAPVTLAGQSIGNGYSMGGQSPDTFVRVDVTYLRQDFSLPQGKTRFDYFVRTRSLSTQEAADFEAQIAKRGPPPSHLAAQRALREITGQTPANATPEAWRHLLKSISAEGTCDHQDSNFGFRFCETGNSLPE